MLDHDLRGLGFWPQLSNWLSGQRRWLTSSVNGETICSVHSFISMSLKTLRTMPHGISLLNADGSTFSADLRVIHWVQVNKKRMCLSDCNALTTIKWLWSATQLMVMQRWTNLHLNKQKTLYKSLIQQLCRSILSVDLHWKINANMHYLTELLQWALNLHLHKQILTRFISKKKLLPGFIQICNSHNLF